MTIKFKLMNSINSTPQ